MRSYISQVSSSKDRPQTRAGVQLLLKNPAYAGINRHGYYARSKIQVKSRDERLAEVVEVDGCHEPLVDRDTFEKVQLRLESNRPQKSGRPHAAFLFTGVIWCACGSRYSGKRSGGGKRVTYYCGRRNNAGDCDSRSVSESRIREVVLTPIKHLLAQLKQKDLRKAVRAELVNEMEASRRSVHEVNEVLSDKLKRLESRLSRLEDGYFDEVISRDRYLTRRDEILVQIADINSSLGARARPVSVDFDQLYALAESITIETLDDQSWRALVESMVERIVIEDTGDGRKDPPKINVHWKPEYVPIINREV
jgi:site-specific DNA recombinase